MQHQGGIEYRLVVRASGSRAERAGSGQANTLIPWQTHSYAGETGKTYNPIWVDSIKGEGRGESQPIFDRDRKSGEQVEMLLEDLFGKSFRAFRTSPEIRQFVENNRPAT